MVSLTFVACNENVANDLNQQSNSSYCEIKVRSPAEHDLKDMSELSASPFPPPPLVVEIIRNFSHVQQKRHVYPAFAAFRVTSPNCSSTSSSMERVKRMQILIPDFDSFLSRSEDQEAPSSLDDIPHRVVADDGGRCIVVASNIDELIKFALSNQETSAGQQLEEGAYWIPPVSLSSRNSVLLSSTDLFVLERQEDEDYGDDNNENEQLQGHEGLDEQPQNKRRELIRRVNGQIVDAAASVMNTVSLSRLARIYDEVDSRKEKILRTRSTGSKDVKTVVIPVVGEEQSGEQKLLKIAFQQL